MFLVQSLHFLLSLFEQCDCWNTMFACLHSVLVPSFASTLPGSHECLMDDVELAMHWKLPV